MTSFFAFWFYVCVIFSVRVNGITTKSLPLILKNNSDPSQFVQIRSALNQPTRAFLLENKSSLSPVQQTHILDDVQKNQRIHYTPQVNMVNLNDRQKSLFVGTPQTSSNVQDQSHKYANFLNLNSLSPPSAQTVVLSPQQTLPTSPSHPDILSYFRPSYTDTKILFPHSSSANVLPQFEPLKISQESQISHELSGNQKTKYYQSAPTSNYPKTYNTDVSKFTTTEPYPRYTKPDFENSYFLNDHYEKYFHSSTSTPRSKPYHIKDGANLFTPPLLQKPISTPPDKIIKEIVIKTNPEELIAKDRQKFFQQLLESDKNLDEGFDNADDQIVAQNDLSSIRSQFEKEVLRQLKGGFVTNPMSDLGLLVNSSSAVSEFSLPSGQKIQISKDYNRLLENDDGSNKIKAIVVKQPTMTTSGTEKNILEELTKGVIPPGAEFEVIKRNKDGGLEEVSKLPQNIPQKKVTFVILEEQSDGSVKVQGVRGSEKESLEQSGEEVDTIIKKIKDGELKLPPSTRLSSSQSVKSIDKVKNNKQNVEENDSKSKRKLISSDTGQRTVKRKEQNNLHFVPTPPTETSSTETYLSYSSNVESSDSYLSSPNIYTVEKKSKNNVFSSTPSYGSLTVDYSENNLDTESLNSDSYISPNSLYDSSTASSLSDNLGLFHLNNSGYIANLFSALKNPSTSVHFPTSDNGNTDILQFPFLPSTSGSTVVNTKARNISNKYPLVDTTIVENAITIPTTTIHAVYGTSTSAYVNKENDNNIYKSKRDRNAIRKTTKKPIKDIRKDNEEEESNVEEIKTEETHLSENNTLSDILKKEGFYAMARFLKQSGLDTILNDTGPFTLFIPTDKAFRTLLIQLGGPDKAEEKFKENPRLLSGLLLHHVIPGAFRINTLQDEMTGVSLAGTQLRVNTYTTHDIEWNDVTVVTVNGAKILDEKDIVIPQGISHAIDRVMFPLPVGNLLQSLQADRENRYSNFLKIIEESELSYLLTGGKTFTLFAPLNRAFTHSEFTRIISDPNESKSFVLRHIVPGALYSAGMKYYQVRDSMEDGQQVTLYKEAGKIKVNSAHVITRNIPTTNGVIHAIDAFL